MKRFLKAMRWTAVGLVLGLSAAYSSGSDPSPDGTSGTPSANSFTILAGSELKDVDAALGAEIRKAPEPSMRSIA